MIFKNFAFIYQILHLESLNASNVLKIHQLNCFHILHSIAI